MTLYDIYDVCDIANEASINETWGYVKNKVKTFFQELVKRIREFGSQVIQSLTKLKEKVKKGDAFDVSQLTFVLNKKTSLDDVQNIIKRSEKLEKRFEEVTDGVLRGDAEIDDCNTTAIQDEVVAIHKSIDGDTNTGSLYFKYE